MSRLPPRAGLPRRPYISWLFELLCGSKQNTESKAIYVVIVC